MADVETASKGQPVDPTNAPGPSPSCAARRPVILATLKEGVPTFIRFCNLTEAGNFLIRSGALERGVL